MALVYGSVVQGGPHFSGGGPNLARVAQINIIGPYGGTPGGPHSIIYPTVTVANKMHLNIPSVPLNDGNRMPIFGLGTYNVWQTLFLSENL